MVFFATPWIPEVSWQPHGLQEETSGIYVVRLIDYGDLYRLYKKLVCDGVTFLTMGFLTMINLSPDFKELK